MSSETAVLLMIGYGAVAFMIVWMNLLGWVDARGRKNATSGIGTTASQHARWVLVAPVWPLAIPVLLIARLIVPLIRDALARR